MLKWDALYIEIVITELSPCHGLVLQNRARLLIIAKGEALKNLDHVNGECFPCVAGLLIPDYHSN